VSWSLDGEVFGVAFEVPEHLVRAGLYPAVVLKVCVPRTHVPLKCECDSCVTD